MKKRSVPYAESIGGSALRKLSSEARHKSPSPGNGCSPVVARIRHVLLERGVPAHKIRPTIVRVCNVTPQSVAKWFNGKTKYPRADHLALLAAAFRVDIYWLILGKSFSDSDLSFSGCLAENGGSCFCSVDGATTARRSTTDL